MTAAAETRKFEAEVAQVLHLVTHSLYSHKEIFLRELVSNASDACDKLRFAAIGTPELLAGDSEFRNTQVPRGAFGRAEERCEPDWPVRRRFLFGVHRR